MKTRSISLVRMTNEVHVQFHESVMTLLNKLTPEALGAVSLGSMYRKALADEAEVLLFIRSSEVSALIVEQDRVRDGIFRGLSDSVKGLRHHFDPEIREAAEQLWRLLLHYGNIANKSLDAQTAATADLLRELRTPEQHLRVKLLVLGSWVEKLGEENDRFATLMAQRYAEVAEQPTLRMRAARQKTDRLYLALAAHVDNLVLTSTGGASAINFVGELDAIIRRFKAILAQRLAVKS